MVLWEQVLTPIYAINEWEAFASLEKHKRKKQRKTQGYKRMCETKQIEKKANRMNCGFRGAGPISWNPLQAAKQRSCGYNMIPHPYRSPKGDWHINYDVEDDSRSRFAEPREGEVILIPQLRSFGACSGFLRVTCPLGTRRCTKLRITDADR